MIRLARGVIYYGIFAAVAFVLHALLLWPKGRLPDRQQVLDLARQIKLELGELEKMSAPAAPPPAPEEPKPDAKPEPEKFKETVRTEGKIPEPAPAEPRPAPPEPSPPAPPDPAPVRAPEPAEKPEPPTEPAKAAEVTKLEEYRQFLSREMKNEGGDSRYVPRMRFGDNTEAENRQIMRYFGMELIAYPKTQKFYVYIDPEQNLYSRSDEFEYIRNFSNRVIFRSSPYFDGLRREAAKRVGLAADALVVAQLLKPASAGYVAWKQSEAARRAGCSLEEVESCEASFGKTGFGAWIVRIDALTLKDGRKIPVQDFEWARVSGGNGAGR